MNTQGCNPVFMYNSYNMYPYPYYANMPMYNLGFPNQLPNQYIPLTGEMEYDSTFNLLRSSEDTDLIQLKDYGPQPFVININEASKQNNTFRTALWTGEHLQVTLMSIDVNDDIGLEIHPDIDQFIRIEEGQGLVKMGPSKDKLDFEEKAYDDSAIMIPAGTWHNIINTGNKPLKVYAIYAPPQHPHGTVHKTKADAEATEENRQVGS